jgi:hypothetical protein
MFKMRVKADDAQLAKLLDGAHGAVEATNEEQHNLWDRFAEGSTKFGNYPNYTKYSWVEAGEGLMEGLDELGDRQVCVELTYATVDGKKIIFYNACSQVVDHQMVRDWLNKVMPPSAFEDGDPRKRLNHSDATNFINVLR